MITLSISRFQRFTLSLASAIFLAAASAHAGVNVTLQWNRNTEPDIAGYRVHYGPINAPYSQTMDIKSNAASISNLAAGTVYLFAVSAYNTAGAESAYSQPIVHYASTNSSNEQQVTLDNISSRAFVQTGDNVMIGGFIVRGTTPKTLVLRALGPSLTAAGVNGAMQDPVLDIRDSKGALIATNDSWNKDDGDALTALGLAPADDREAALVVTLPAGSYSAIVHGKGSSRGVALFELYNLEHSLGSVANISTRGRVGSGDDVMIGGFIVGGADATKVIVRAVGPSLTSQGVADALLDPALDLYDSQGNLIASDDNWRSSQQAAIIDTTVPPSDDREAAIVRTLAPGAYSAIVRGQDNTTGVALFELYALDR
jgi:fibronectin type III domain protein